MNLFKSLFLYYSNRYDEEFTLFLEDYTENFKSVTFHYLNWLLTGSPHTFFFSNAIKLLYIFSYFFFVCKYNFPG